MQGMRPGRAHTSKHVQTLRATKVPAIPERFLPATWCRCEFPRPYVEAGRDYCRCCSREIRKETTWTP